MVIHPSRRLPVHAVICLALFNILSVPTVHAAHPLITEDTGTQGSGNGQLELTYDLSRFEQPGTRQTAEASALVLSYGLGDTLDAIVSIPYSRVRPDSASATHGVGDVEFGAKWRFYENGSLSLALRSGITVTTGNERNDLGAGRPAQSVFAAATHTTGPWAWHLHAGYTHNHNNVGERESIRHVSLAATRRFGERLQLVTDFNRETNPDRSSGEPLTSAVIGLIYSLNKDFDLDIGYRAGLTEATPDHALLFGITARF